MLRYHSSGQRARATTVRFWRVVPWLGRDVVLERGTTTRVQLHWASRGRSKNELHGGRKRLVVECSAAQVERGTLLHIMVRRRALTRCIYYMPVRRG